MGVPFSRPIFLLTGDLYPGYQTFKALETKNNDPHWFYDYNHSPGSDLEPRKDLLSYESFCPNL